MAVTVQFYNSFLTNLGNGTSDLTTGGTNVKIALMTSVHTFATSASTWASVSSNEVNGNGYTAGGTSCSGVTWTTSASSVTFDFSDPQWTASGGDIRARHAVVYVSTGATDGSLICNIDFGEDVIASNGANFNIVLDAAGLFTIS